MNGWSMGILDGIPLDLQTLLSNWKTGLQCSSFHPYTVHLYAFQSSISHSVPVEHLTLQRSCWMSVQCDVFAWQGISPGDGFIAIALGWFSWLLAKSFFLSDNSICASLQKERERNSNGELYEKFSSLLHCFEKSRKNRGFFLPEGNCQLLFF